MAATARDHRGQRDDYHREIVRMHRAPRNYAGSFGIEFRSRRTRLRIFRILGYLESIPIYPDRALPFRRRGEGGGGECTKLEKGKSEQRFFSRFSSFRISFRILSIVSGILYEYISTVFRRLHSLRPICIYIYIVVGYRQNRKFTR